MNKLTDHFLLWLSNILQPIVEKKFVLKDTWELEKVENKGIKLPYVLFENKSLVINNFFFPVHLVRMRFQLFDKEINVGRILYDGSTKIAPKSKKTISMEVRLNHITALFNMLRFVFTTSNIQMTIKGEVQLKILGLNFFIPVNDVLDLPKNKVQMIMNTIDNRTSVSTIPFEEVKEDVIEDASIIIDSNSPLINSVQEDLKNKMLPSNLEETNSPSSEHTS